MQIADDRLKTCCRTFISIVMQLVLCSAWESPVLRGAEISSARLHSAFCNLKSHKFHVTNSQIEYNQAERSVEIVIRVFADDFQSAISKHSSREVKLDRPEDWQDKTRAALILAYLNENFVLKSKAGRQVKLTWVGMAGVADMFWVYVAGKMPGGIAGAQLKNRLHCELFDDQVNVVNTKFQSKQIGLMFEPKDEFKIITEKRSS